MINTKRPCVNRSIK